MNQLINFDDCEPAFRFYGGAEKKGAIIYNGKNYLLKFPKSPKIKNDLNSSYTNNVFSEYICCHIIHTLNIPVQNTLLGTKNGKIVVACEDFTSENEKLYEFFKFENSYLEKDSNSKHTELYDALEIIDNHERILNKSEYKKYFWDMFVVDAFIGNFDRHTGNFGFLVNEKEHITKPSPIYDCGSCMYPALSDDVLSGILVSEEEINMRIYDFPNSSFTINKQKINYYDFMINSDLSEFKEAVLRIVPNIDLNKIDDIIDETPELSNVRNKFYKTMIRERYEKILLPVYRKIYEKEILDLTDEDELGRK